MSQPWFEPNTFGAWYGTIAGCAAGIFGGVIGGVGGYLAPRGVGRRWVLGAMWLMVVLGVIQLAGGAAAWWLGQPFGIWYCPLLCGVILCAVCGGLIPVFRARYAAAEQRRLASAALRQS